VGDAAEFRGVIGRYRSDSEPWWPSPPSPPPGAPNLVTVVLDDVGFAQLGCYGSDIETPTIDRLAAGGLRYRNFHTTALCSPTRACLLTGRNHHSVGVGRVTDLATGFPGYDGRIPASAGMLPEMVVPHGYAAYAVGKWHLTPDEDSHLGGSRATWPLGRGFERFYGFFGGETNQFEPALTHDNHRVAPPRTPAEGYHLSEDLADRAIEMVADLRHVQPDQPFVLHLAFGACHSPHQAPQRWLDRYRGRFDQGWDRWRAATLERQHRLGVVDPDVELSPRPDWVPAWDSLEPDERRLFARYMECFAATLSHADEQLGRVVDFLDRTGDLDRTLLMVLSDNGASSEGGVTGSINDVRPWNLADRPVDEALDRIDELGGPWLHNNYPWGWTVAGNTPFRRWKREVHEGGTCDPLVVHWPAGIEARGEVRGQYVHAVDLLPTALEAAGIAAPATIGGVAQKPIEGVSIITTFGSADAPEVRGTQYYEMLGCRALYHEGWKAVTYISMMKGETASDDDRWELYDVRADPTEGNDLAAAEPERLAAMVERWWAEAEAHQVLPVDSMPFFEAMAREPVSPARARYRYWPGSGPVHEAGAVDVRCRSHEVVVDLTVPDGGDADGLDADGVLVCQGSGFGGWALWLAGGRLHYAHNHVSMTTSRVRSDVVVPPGRHRLGVRYDHGRAGTDGTAAPDGGIATLLVDGAEDASVAIPRFTLTRWSICGDGLSVGRSMALPVVRDWSSPFAFGGTIHEVTIDVDGGPGGDGEARAEQAMRAP
jgi:arylsulfatase